MPVTLQSSGGGSVQLAAPSTASNRTLTMPDATGVVAYGTAAGQVQFPATQNASSDPNCLDDYEEGTWTPTVTAQSGSFTSVSATGAYTKIGRQVTVKIEVTITTAGTAATSTQVTLPFNPNGLYMGSGRESGSTGYGLTFYMDTGSIGRIQKYDGTFIGSNGYLLVVTGTYFI